MQPHLSAYHCAICLLRRNPVNTLNGSTITRIIAQGRPTPALPGLSKECRYKGKVFTRRFKKDNYSRYNWISGCGVENKLFCWPCFIFSTDPTDTWGFKGFDGLSNFSNSVKTHLNQELHNLNIDKYNIYAPDEHKIWSERLPMHHSYFTIGSKEMNILPDFPTSNNISQEADGYDEDNVNFIRHPDVMIELVDDTESENTDKHAIFSGDDSQNAAPGAEKYQLKWHSHQQNLNSSISCLYKNDRYADVMLITCNSEENFAIPAHKLVLGTSSTYFANIFDKNFAPANAMTYIVLPPELTKRALQTLIQYMYTGESTVSVDILNEVLRGGEILKIRGLWRNQTEPSANTDPQGSKDSSNRQRTERISVDRFPVQEPRIAQNPVTIHDSPVIVTNSAKSYGISQTAQMPASSSAPIINIKKDVAIDPGERSSRTHSKKRTSQESNQPAQQQPNSALPNTDQRPSPGSAARSIPEDLNFLSVRGVKEEPVEWTDVNAEEMNLDESEMPMVKVESKELAPADENDAENQDHMYSPLTCELCSETFTVPAEWVRHIESHSDTPHTVSKKRRRIENDNEADVTAALKCDLCAMYFVTPAEWVRHVQSTHTETELAISNNSGYSRRRSKSTTSDPHHSAATTTAASQQQEKSCTICNKSFPSYASMLIHKRTHTGERPFYCDICNKGFNVKSNLLRHMRTLHNQHGGQSPTSGGDSHGSD